jgi:hypothetical protein
MAAHQADVTSENFYFRAEGSGNRPGRTTFSFVHGSVYVTFPSGAVIIDTYWSMSNEPDGRLIGADRDSECRRVTVVTVFVLIAGDGEDVADLSAGGTLFDPDDGFEMGSSALLTGDLFVRTFADGIIGAA